MKTENQERFFAEYKKQLHKAVETRPDCYVWPMTELDEVFERMKLAVIRKSFNKDGLAFKWTCKALKIKHTYRDIETYLGHFDR